MTASDGAGRTRIDIGPPGGLLVLIATVATWAVGFTVVWALAAIAVLLGRPAIDYDRLLLPLGILGLLAGVVAGVASLLPRALVVDASGLAIRRLGRVRRIEWHELTTITVVQGRQVAGTRGLRRVAWFVMITPRDPQIGDRSRLLRWHRGDLWVGLWSGRAATRTALALQDFAGRRYLGLTTTDVVPQPLWPGRG